VQLLSSLARPAEVTDMFYYEL